jgi:membrane-associated phospholipid phosphatase
MKALRVRRWIAPLVVAVTVIPALPAQTTGAAGADTVIADKSLFIRKDWYVLGAFTAATIAMFPLDRHLASVIRDEDLITNRDLRDLASTFRFFGGPGPFLIGSAMYVAGRYAHVKRAADLAVHGTEAVVIGLGTSFALKTVLGRGRPYISADTNPRNFGLGRGFTNTDYQSFPSGHSTAAFAAAAAVSAETAEWWPQHRMIVRILMYGGATLVGVSRMYDDKHWASDVVMGAAIGTFAGLKVVRFTHTHAGNRIDRWLLGKSGEQPHLRFFGDRWMLGLSAGVTW